MTVFVMQLLAYLCDEHSELVKVAEAVRTDSQFTDDFVEFLSSFYWVLVRGGGGGGGREGGGRKGGREGRRRKADIFNGSVANHYLLLNL